MAFSSFLRRLRSRRRQRPQNPFTRTRLTLEHLELRDLPSTLTIDAAGALTYRASTSIANDLTLGVSGDHYTITDTAETILVSGAGSGGCTGSGTHTVTCPLVNVHSLLFILNDAGDALHLLSTGSADHRQLRAGERHD